MCYRLWCSRRPCLRTRRARGARGGSSCARRSARSAPRGGCHALLVEVGHCRPLLPPHPQVDGGFRGGALYSASFDLGTQLLFKHLDHGAPPALGVAPSLHLLLLPTPKMSHE